MPKRIILKIVVFIALVYFLAVDIADGLGHTRYKFWPALIIAPFFLLEIIKDIKKALTRPCK